MKTTIYLFGLCLLSACAPAVEQSGKPEHADPVPPSAALKDTLPGKTDTQVAYDTYCNERYGYCLSYPAAMVLMQPEAQSGDGRIFNNTEGEELGRVYRSLSADPDVAVLIPGDAMKADIADLKAGLAKDGQGTAEITYATSGKHFFVYSARAGNSIYYRKAIFRADEYAMLMFKYPEEQKARYDVIVSKMSSSFHW